MAEGFLQQQSRSFFLHASNDRLLFVMHDLINDLATSVAGDFFSRLGIEIKKEIRKEALEKYLHMSFVCEDYMVYKRFEAFKRAKSLRTFLGVSFEVKENWETFYLSNKILTNLLHELPLLRVLNLSHLSISEVPEFIGSLKQLQYLNLFRTSITHLPENICNLYNSQTLIVFGCHGLIK
jgi:Leucine-rich repeat (LRR) protein